MMVEYKAAMGGSFVEPIHARLPHALMNLSEPKGKIEIGRPKMRTCDRSCQIFGNPELEDWCAGSRDMAVNT